MQRDEQPKPSGAGAEVGAWTLDDRAARKTTAAKDFAAPQAAAPSPAPDSAETGAGGLLGAAEKENAGESSGLRGREATSRSECRGLGNVDQERAQKPEGKSAPLVAVTRPVALEETPAHASGAAKSAAVPGRVSGDSLAKPTAGLQDSSGRMELPGASEGGEASQPEASIPPAPERASQPWRSGASPSGGSSASDTGPGHLAERLASAAGARTPSRAGGSVSSSAHPSSLSSLPSFVFSLHSHLPPAHLLQPTRCHSALLPLSLLNSISVQSSLRPPSYTAPERRSTVPPTVPTVSAPLSASASTSSSLLPSGPPSVAPPLNCASAAFPLLYPHLSAARRLPASQHLFHTRSAASDFSAASKHLPSVSADPAKAQRASSLDRPISEAKPASTPASTPASKPASTPSSPRASLSSAAAWYATRYGPGGGVCGNVCAYERDYAAVLTALRSLETHYAEKRKRVRDSVLQDKKEVVKDTTHMVQPFSVVKTVKVVRRRLRRFPAASRIALHPLQDGEKGSKVSAAGGEQGAGVSQHTVEDEWGKQVTAANGTLQKLRSGRAAEQELSEEGNGEGKEANRERDSGDDGSAREASKGPRGLKEDGEKPQFFPREGRRVDSTGGEESGVGETVSLLRGEGEQDAGESVKRQLNSGEDGPATKRRRETGEVTESEERIIVDEEVSIVKLHSIKEVVAHLLPYHTYFIPDIQALASPFEEAREEVERRRARLAELRGSVRDFASWVRNPVAAVPLEKSTEKGEDVHTAKDSRCFHGGRETELMAYLSLRSAVDAVSLSIRATKVAIQNAGSAPAARPAPLAQPPASTASGPSPGGPNVVAATTLGPPVRAPSGPLGAPSSPRSCLTSGDDLSEDRSDLEARTRGRSSTVSSSLGPTSRTSSVARSALGLSFQTQERGRRGEAPAGPYAFPAAFAGPAPAAPRDRPAGGRVRLAVSATAAAALERQSGAYGSAAEATVDWAREGKKEKARKERRGQSDAGSRGGRREEETARGGYGDAYGRHGPPHAPAFGGPPPHFPASEGEMRQASFPPSQLHAQTHATLGCPDSLYQREDREAGTGRIRLNIGNADLLSRRG
ncbi:hypothetical protein TGRUB_229790 [Toxoplasma gondii RUB]|uniref:Uncharacterized protein n=1 Tax=Toxoplasma gondii RUB TaxID=935652 RepID=A0A086M3R5_TOXGO|nr:hypothetical protein TGRUB_229790 [Toxoplasma gondii RUB]